MPTREQIETFSNNTLKDYENTAKEYMSVVLPAKKTNGGGRKKTRRNRKKRKRRTRKMRGGVDPVTLVGLAITACVFGWIIRQCLAEEGPQAAYYRDLRERGPFFRGNVNYPSSLPRRRRNGDEDW